MLQRIREARKNESGFTLIELLIVIVILGVLAGIVVFSLNAFTNNGESAACQTDVSSVTNAIEDWHAQNRSLGYPADGAAAQSDVVPDYLHSWPSGTTITYTKTANSFTVTGQNGNASC